MLFAEREKRKKRRKKIKSLINSVEDLQVPILILNEIWLQSFNKRFKNTRSEKLESDLKECLKKQSRLTEVLKKLHERKKENLNVILKLTPQVFEMSNDSAKTRMETLQKEVLEINDGLEKLSEELSAVPIEINKVNRELLNETIEICYDEMLANQEKLEELSPKIDKMREELKALVEQHAICKDAYENTYILLHNLVGEDLIDRLDDTYTGETKSEYNEKP